GNWKGKLPVKTVLSCLFVFIAMVQAHPIPGYYYLLLIGLIFCLGGDVFLALPQDKMFLTGLVSFLLGHVFYGICFFYAADVGLWTLIGGLAALTVSAVVFFRLRPHLDEMLMPVLAYIFVITLMVVGAWTVLTDAQLDFTGRLLVFVGAASFYFSDVFVARDRFLKSAFINRLIGLPMYYCGQFLLAFSAGFI
ncbi:MAG: lysoplasmalogenase, partial [Desulfobacterales bacterium]